MAEAEEAGRSIFVELTKRYGESAISTEAYEDIKIGGDSRFFDGEIGAAELDSIMKKQS